jgi:Tol biopolymer transport system component
MRHFTFALSFALVATTAGSGPTLATQDASPRLMTVRDTQNLVNVGSPAISPDGHWVLYTRAVRDWDDQQLRTRTHIWRVRIDGTDARQLTFGTANTTSPAWFPDGTRIAFLSSRQASPPQPSAQGGDQPPGGGNQVFIMHTDGGEAWQATKHEGGVSGFSISPDGKTILLTAQEPLTAAERRRQRDRDDAEVVDETFRWTHLWTFDIESEKTERLTRGEFVVSDPQWSPDGRTIAYVRRPTTRVDDSAWSDVWVTDLAGNTRKFFDNEGPDTSPRWSPDGRMLAIASKPAVRQHAVVQQAARIPRRGRHAAGPAGGFRPQLRRAHLEPRQSRRVLVHGEGHANRALRRGRHHGADGDDPGAENGCEWRLAAGTRTARRGSSATTAASSRQTSGSRGGRESRTRRPSG